MNYRRAAKDDYLDGTETGSLKVLFEKMSETDVWVNL